MCSNVHAADVTQRVFTLLTRGGRKGLLADKVACAAMVIAAAIHDYGHLGVTNAFLIATDHPLAITYSDKSPLENFHLAGSFALLKRPELNFMEGVPQATIRRIRATVIKMVTATDMVRHTQFMGQVQGSMKSERAGKGTIDPAAVWCLQLAIKAADVGHCFSPPEPHARWVDRLSDEMRAQGRRELELGLPVSPLMAPDGPGVKASQVAFFSVVVLPMVVALIEVFGPGCEPWLDQALDNFSGWCRQSSVLTMEQQGRPVPTMRAMSTTSASLIQRLDGQRGVLRVAESMARMMADELDFRTARRFAFLYLCRASGELDVPPLRLPGHIEAKRLRRLVEAAVTSVCGDPLLAVDIADRVA